MYDNKLKEAKKAGLRFIPNGTLKYIFPLETVRSREKRGTLTAYNKNQQSPINKIEPMPGKKWVAH
jgi:hypothetical protein